jgi:DNA invertase Pin-like site-specific DNA recombinase
MARVALYARRSKAPRGWKPATPGEEAPGSIQAQMARLEGWARANGHEVVLRAMDTRTGRDPNRPGWQKILGAVKGGHVQVLAITKTDRAMRSTAHYLQTIDVLLERGVQLEVLDQPMASLRGQGDPMAVAFRTVAAAFAQLERDLATERSAEVLEVRADGRTYGPRSSRPAGRPSVYSAASGHRMRVRAGRPVHDKAKCKACGWRNGGSDGPPGEGVSAGGLA